MVNALAIIIVVVGNLLGATGSLCLKKGSSKFSMNILEQVKNTHLIIGLMLYIFGNLIFIYALSLEKLSTLNPFNALLYFWVSLFSVLFLKEKMNKHKFLGVLLIIIGAVIFTYFAA